MIYFFQFVKPDVPSFISLPGQIIAPPAGYVSDSIIFLSSILVLLTKWIICFVQQHGVTEGNFDLDADQQIPLFFYFQSADGEFSSDVSREERWMFSPRQQTTTADPSLLSSSQQWICASISMVQPPFGLPYIIFELFHKRGCVWQKTCGAGHKAPCAATFRCICCRRLDPGTS